ncbi:MAG: DUF1735 domain-containing protein [Bacteroidota bacterium]|uniref:DUF1735 domain-containing protein n=1 Tax=Parabacteroides sp. FAFU027 TaxID=2922715 RepID=UPI001FAF6729|nr:DUF1735 domain-containing protein [Parabacteroides sp. FAFU027]MDP4269717.1 DUF1735 domain-containing protein [Bacteroidota bacterium]
MKRYAKHMAATVMAVLFLTSCFRENMDTFGSYYIYMSKDTTYLELKDTLLRQASDTLLKDTAIRVLGVTRSGISSEYPALSVRLKVDSAYMDSMLAVYNDVTIPTASKSSSVLYFKNTMILPADCYQLERSLVIPKDVRTGQINLRLNLTKIAKLKTTKSLVLPLGLVNTSGDTIRASKKRVMVRLKPKFNYKDVAL